MLADSHSHSLPCCLVRVETLVMLHQQQVGQLFADTWLIPNLVVNFIKIEKKNIVSVSNWKLPEKHLSICKLAYNSQESLLLLKYWSNLHNAKWSPNGCSLKLCSRSRSYLLFHRELAMNRDGSWAGWAIMSLTFWFGLCAMLVFFIARVHHHHWGLVE